MTSPEQSAAPAACEWQIEHSYLEAFEKFYKLDCRFGMTNTEAIAAFRKRLLAAAPSPAPVDLEGVLVDVCQLIDGWHTDVVWSEWDESVRWRVHCELAKMNGQEPLPRDSFRHPSAAPVPPSPLAEENARTESPSAQEYEPSAEIVEAALAAQWPGEECVYSDEHKSAEAGMIAALCAVAPLILAAERKKVIEECAELCERNQDGSGGEWDPASRENARAIRSLAATEGREMTDAPRLNYMPTMDEAVRFIRSNPQTSWEIVIDALGIGSEDNAQVSGGRFRELWKLAGGEVDKKGRAWVEMQVLPTVLGKITDAISALPRAEKEMK